MIKVGSKVQLKQVVPYSRDIGNVVGFEPPDTFIVEWLGSFVPTPFVYILEQLIGLEPRRNQLS
jgi:hypothetical protein